MENKPYTVDNTSLTDRPKLVCDDFIKDETAETTFIVGTPVAKSDGDGLESATNTAQLTLVVTEQIDSLVRPFKIQLLDALTDCDDFIKDETAETTFIVGTPVAKSDGDGLESATNRAQLKSAATEQIDSLDETAETTFIVGTPVAKSDGDGLESATNRAQLKSAATEQIDSLVRPFKIQLLDSLSDCDDFIKDETAETTFIVGTPVAKSDGDGLESATNTAQLTLVVTEQIDSLVTPVRIELLNSLADCNDLVPDVAAADRSSIATKAMADGDGLEPATTTAHVKSAAENPRQGRRRSFLSAVGRRLLKFGRALCCCCK
ncbi:uncharacterized protein LOC107884419 isoform X3 [Acyrthosiphon pisum]|uniref:Uncharacterized protein n=1 Tax=Acyrthosiphon pisum TaxID=7029 RepID=A0A8R2HA54_ACYPI|nr:uncharacterized protein LOC107884419 isoform X3 [Acyrthosiphon pisum]|eukprot:XP_016661911.1 PREDICTED: uncharacterized protein LOC107884419 isoform X3 [Acyrthosiphon pisum]